MQQAAEISPEEIAQACEEIRESWSPRERWIRSGELDYQAFCEMRERSRRMIRRRQRRRRREERRAEIQALMAELQRRRQGETDVPSETSQA